MFQVPRRDKRLDVLIPSSFAKDTPHLRDRTLRIGMLARFLAAARVDTLILYHVDPAKPDDSNARFLKLLMEYLNTAPYLRKRLYRIRRELRYAGVLPPLNIPTHPESRSMDVEHYREGLVLESDKGSLIEAGLGKPIRVRKRLKKGARIILKVSPSRGRLKASAVSRRKSEIYPGFRVGVAGEKLSEIVKVYDLRIATSRKGRDILTLLDELRKRIDEAKKICIAFGSAREGLYEIAERQGFSLEESFDYVLNTFPGQG
ncbi:MAG: hypothetical protein DRN68_08470, partial [Thaumarchaeota archaeon]